MTAGTELEREVMGLRPGRRPAQPKPIELTHAEELELAKAKAGRVEWVGPGVAAYILGISKEALKKRRLRGEGVVIWLPENGRHEAVSGGSPELPGVGIG
uniref:hypothetical protein n=1 Tax=Stenotrophomonas sp. 3(2025) TaxID=3456023 RepID=UPI00404518BB